MTYIVQGIEYDDFTKAAVRAAKTKEHLTIRVGDYVYVSELVRKIDALTEMDIENYVEESVQMLVLRRHLSNSVVSAPVEEETEVAA